MEVCSSIRIEFQTRALVEPPKKGARHKIATIRSILESFGVVKAMQADRLDCGKVTGLGAAGLGGGCPRGPVARHSRQRRCTRSPQPAERTWRRNVPRTRCPTSVGHALRAPERAILTGFVLGPSNPRLARPARQPDFTGDRHRIPWTRRSVLSIAAPGEPLHGPDVRRRGGQPQNRRRRPGNFGFAGRRRRTSGRQESRTQPSASIDSFRPALGTPAMKQRLATEAKSAPLRRERFQATLRRGSGSR